MATDEDGREEPGKELRASTKARALVDQQPSAGLKPLVTNNMARLPKYTLSKNEKQDNWQLKNDSTNRVVKEYDTKGQATKGGALERAVGSNGGSVKIQKENGRIQEERTYPGSRDPGKSPG